MNDNIVRRRNGALVDMLRHQEEVPVMALRQCVVYHRSGRRIPQRVALLTNGIGCKAVSGTLPIFDVQLAATASFSEQYPILTGNTFQGLWP